MKVKLSESEGERKCIICSLVTCSGLGVLAGTFWEEPGSQRRSTEEVTNKGRSLSLCQTNSDRHCHSAMLPEGSLSKHGIRATIAWAQPETIGCHEQTMEGECLAGGRDGQCGLMHGRMGGLSGRGRSPVVDTCR